MQHNWNKQESWQRVAGDEAENFIETKFSRVLDVKELALVWRQTGTFIGRMIQLGSNIHWVYSMLSHLNFIWLHEVRIPILQMKALRGNMFI